MQGISIEQLEEELKYIKNSDNGTRILGVDVYDKTFEIVTVKSDKKIGVSRIDRIKSHNFIE